MSINVTPRDPDDIALTRANLRYDLWRRRAEAAEAELARLEKAGLRKVTITPADAPHDVLLDQNTDLAKKLEDAERDVEEILRVNSQLTERLQAALRALSETQREKTKLLSEMFESGEHRHEAETALSILKQFPSPDGFRQTANLLLERFVFVSDERARSAIILRLIAEALERFQDRERQTEIPLIPAGGKE